MKYMAGAMLNLVRMRKTPRFNLVWLCLLAVTGTLRADNYNYSYIFGSGDIVSGSFSATHNGNVYDTVSDISLYFNGTLLGTSLFAGSALDFDNALWQVGPIIGDEVKHSNFVFTNDESFLDPLATPNYDTAFYFYILNGSVSTNTPASDASWLEPNGDPLQLRDSPASGSWLVSPAAPASVPDEGSIIAMLGFALGTLVTVRRLRSASL